jgi:hypothetical protein
MIGCDEYSLNESDGNVRETCPPPVCGITLQSERNQAPDRNGGLPKRSTQAAEGSIGFRRQTKRMKRGKLAFPAAVDFAASLPETSMQYGGLAVAALSEL